jgi:predicted GH43/DUF377 family glycosyl hydrolase/uncharacterized membrane protein
MGNTILFQSHESEIELKDLIDQKDNIFPSQSENLLSIPSRGSQNTRNLVVSTAHGGSWVDNFVDESGVDTGLSDNIKIEDGDSKILINPFEVDSNTVALWHFDEGAGNTAYDETTNNNDGTLGGDGVGSDLPTWTNGRFGNALGYDGADDYVLVSDTNDLSVDTTGKLTVEFWLKTRHDVTTRQFIITKGAQISSSAPWEWAIWILNGNLQCSITDSVGNNIRRENVGVSPNSLYHCVVVFNGDTQNDEIDIYFNGVESSTINNQASFTYSNTNSDLGIGRAYNSGSWRYYSGIVDEVRISNIARRPKSVVGYLTSKPITLSSNMQWDSIFINKTQPLNTYLNITILNATNNQPIPGSTTFSNTGEIDISFIDPIKYPFIKLNASFTGNNWALTPVLHSWGVSWNATNSWRDTVYGGLKCTNNNLITDYNELWVKSDITKWVKYSGNPIISDGPSSSFDDNGVIRGSVVYNGTSYMLYYEGRESSKWEIGLATSQDGLSWSKYSGNPVLTLGTSSAWDDAYVGNPIVIFDGNNYQMWYQGRRSGVGWKIGYATSNDGINWQKYSNNPVLNTGGGGSWEERDVGDPHVIYDGYEYKMWYTGVNTGSVKRIGFATSFDGKNWTKYSNNPVFQYSGGISSGDISVLSQNNQYLAWIMKIQSSNTIEYLNSIQGTVWNIHQNNPMLQKGPSGSWDDNQVSAPFVIKKDKQYSMYYGGFSGSKVQIGLAKSKCLASGAITSTEITLPSKCTYDQLIINKSEPTGTYINVSILDGTTQNVITNFENIRGDTIDISEIYHNDHPSIIIKANFDTTSGFNTPILYDWSVNWTVNKPPNILTVDSNSTVNRTHSIQIEIDLYDFEESEKRLTVQAQYKSPSDIAWQTDYLSGMTYISDHWECTFTPAASAELGLYNFTFRCNDSFQLIDTLDMIHLIRVVNNKPTPPDVVISPRTPRTRQDIHALARNSTDIDIGLGEITYWYRWYWDNFYMSAYENSTMIPSLETAKDQTWRCVAFPFDGDDLGTQGEASVTILNSPPEVENPFNNTELLEDSTLLLENKLTTVFIDPDGDQMAFSVTGNENLSFEITQSNGTLKILPPPNWFGTETVTFFASDTSPIAAEETVVITVIPQNDLPRILKVGNQDTNNQYSELEFMVLQDEWINLSVAVDDIDGDVHRGMITYILNITERIGLYFDNTDNKLIFHPTNDDVGWHYINISITDNNETPIQYISQQIKILVLNVNDPPTVSILAPTIGEVFIEKNDIIFNCTADDIDFEVWNSVEKLTYRWEWESNTSESGILGVSQRITDNALKPGSYDITVFVTDSGGATTSATVNVTIKPITTVPKVKPPPTISGSNFFLILGLLVLIIIIVIVVALMFVLTQKKKKEAAAGIPEGQALQPDAAYVPPTASSLITPTAKSPQLTGPQVIPSGSLAAAPTQEILGTKPSAAPTLAAQPTQPTAAQLPPVQPTGVTTGQIPSEPPSPPEVGEPETTSQDKLKMLDDRLIRGEIDQDVYLELKAKLEFEAKPYQPAPQLPPATVTIEQESVMPATGPPTPAPTPTPTPTQISTPLPTVQTTPPDTVEVPSEVPPAITQPEQVPSLVEPELPSELPSDAYQGPPEQVPQHVIEHDVPEDVVVAEPDMQAATQDLQSAQVVKPTDEGAVFHEGDKSVWKPDVRGKAAASKEVLEQIEKLGELKAKGLITEEEFLRKKEELLK